METSVYLATLKQRKAELDLHKEQLIAQLNATMGACQEVERLIQELEAPPAEKESTNERPGRPALVDDNGRAKAVPAG